MGMCEEPGILKLVQRQINKFCVVGVCGNWGELPRHASAHAQGSCKAQYLTDKGRVAC